MKVRITQEHIDKGERHACGRCPIALAIKERKGVIYVNILHDSAYIKYTKSSTTYFMSKEGSTFITLFDKGKKVEPFTLELKDKVNENTLELTTPGSFFNLWRFKWIGILNLKKVELFTLELRDKVNENS